MVVLGPCPFFLIVVLERKFSLVPSPGKFRCKQGPQIRLGMEEGGGADSGGPFLHSNDRIEPKKPRILSKEIRGKG